MPARRLVEHIVRESRPLVYMSDGGTQCERTHAFACTEHTNTHKKRYKGKGERRRGREKGEVRAVLAPPCVTSPSGAPLVRIAYAFALEGTLPTTPYSVTNGVLVSLDFPRSCSTSAFPEEAEERQRRASASVTHGLHGSALAATNLAPRKRKSVCVIHRGCDDGLSALPIRVAEANKRNCSSRFCELALKAPSASTTLCSCVKLREVKWDHGRASVKLPHMLTMRTPGAVFRSIHVRYAASGGTLAELHVRRHCGDTFDLQWSVPQMAGTDSR